MAFRHQILLSIKVHLDIPSCFRRVQNIHSRRYMTRCSSSPNRHHPVDPVWQVWWSLRPLQGQFESTVPHLCTEHANSYHSYLHFGYVFCLFRHPNIGCTARMMSWLNWESCVKTRHQKERRTLSLEAQTLNYKNTYYFNFPSNSSVDCWVHRTKINSIAST